ncbi:MAG: C25 family cysteine peptidase, partial [Cyclobacteriaceae bacterium]
MAGQTAKWFLLEEKPSNKSYVEFTSPGSGLTIWDVTDENNIVAIGTNPAGPNLSAVVPNTSSKRRLFVKNTFTTPSIKKISFRQILPANHNYIILSNKALAKPALGYTDPVRAYGGFRASAEGGAYDTLVVMMDQLYDQFNFGESSSSAIYEFMKYLVDGGNPQYLFLIGKGLNVSQGAFRKITFGPNDFRDLVPSAGMPGSDMAFTAGLDGTSYEPAVPTGRITASTPAQVASYLNKIKETEQLPFIETWRKEVLHLSGGIQPLELTTFKQYMENFGEVAQEAYYGGSVTTIGKQEPNPVELINVSEEVNEGVNLITFFGHSSPNTIDIDIGFASDPVLGYNNSGKYPAFLINGCNAGVFFANTTVFGEDWVLAANKGARNFIAHSSFGFVGTLRAYTQLFYEVGFGDSTFIRTGIGDIQKEVARRYLETNSLSISTVTQVQQMMMLGDPAVKLFGALKPDYETNNSAIYLESFDGSPVTALSDSFALKVITKNFGSVSKASLQARVTRTFNDKSTASYDSIFPSPKSQDTLTFKIKKEEGVSGFGSNQFLVELDYNEQIDELNEDNNQGQLELFIPLSGTKNLLPRSFEIVNQSNVKLIWQNTDLLSASRPYEIEIDTVDTFNSTFLKAETVIGKV